jgi:transcriptional regulator with XRE-family HTH domain
VLASVAMTVQRHEICWIPEAIADVVRRNDIRDRAELANVLGISRSHVYSVFNADWSGTATTTVLAQLAGVFGVPIGQLVAVSMSLTVRGTERCA